METGTLATIFSGESIQQYLKLNFDKIDKNNEVREREREREIERESERQREERDLHKRIYSTISEIKFRQNRYKQWSERQWDIEKERER